MRARVRARVRVRSELGSRLGASGRRKRRHRRQAQAAGGRWQAAGGRRRAAGGRQSHEALPPKRRGQTVDSLRRWHLRAHTPLRARVLVTLLARLLVAHLVRVGVGVKVRVECCGLSGAQVAVAPVVVGIFAWVISTWVIYTDCTPSGRREAPLGGTCSWPAASICSRNRSGEGWQQAIKLPHRWLRVEPAAAD